MIEQFMNHDHDVFTSTRKRNDHGSSLKVNEEETISHQETIQHNDLAEEGNTSYQLGGSYITTKPVKLASHDLQILVGWYLETIEQRQLNGNKKEWPKLVVILEDFESFDPLLLQDFMTIISEYRVQLPFVFIIGIATSTEILHQSLTKSTICLLRIEKFWLQQSDVWFNRVLDKIFIESDFTLKFGAKPYKFLLDHFYLFDFSISKVKASVKYALMHHFYSNPLSIFLSLAGQPYTTLLETVTRWYQENIITVDHAAHVRMLRSFRQFIEDLEDELDKNRQLALKLLNDDCYLMTEQLATWLVDLGRYQRHFQRGMALLQFLQSQFPHTKKKTRRLLYLEQLENSQWGTQADTIQYLVTLVRKMEATALEPFLEQLTNILQDYDDNTWKDKMTTWQHQLKTWQSASDQEKAKMKQKEKRLEGMIVSSTNRIPTSMESSSSRQTKTAEKVQENAFAQLREKGTLTSKMAMEIADWLQSILRHDLRSYTSIPAHELIYYTHVKLHEKSFAPQPRGSIQTALNQSQYYLNCDCCQQDRQSLLPSEQDTSLLYKLYLECGRMINLYDWFVAFGCLIEREHRPDGHPLDENEVQARFIRSVAELQFLGFIKSTQRKTDHVIRLTWSNI
ncbi:origin recognition complex subunit 3 N-terminus-domain-containing protein [Halteromyces radiatus]|uniref:origin recognition complex subunit 3 N-terminus-domain-containing protein n=1 Tax=Halteromyces radiatus TaxID=101107 RepID=UPI00221FBCAF|nr:origin recognition complex subunit 3 N-terminus-domain-containing protein [Halteromyces radiatus]KAI8093724.1 origin recognition complex subunit 3 N-terminus-domain-containing protein [Halteromyces radiatus]